MKIIVGLGNPGSRYEGTRHNIGFEAVDQMAGSYGISVKQRVGRSIIGIGKIASQEAVLAKPQTYMNRSGEAVLSVLSHFNVDPSKLIVIHDDLDLPLGRLRIKRGGGDGGHRGIQSVVASLGTGRFVRVKVGVGRPVGEAEDHVLGPFNRGERRAIGGVLERVGAAVELLVGDRIEEAMNRYNRVEDGDT